MEAAAEGPLSQGDMKEAEKGFDDLLCFLRALEAERKHPDVLKLLACGYFDLASFHRELHQRQDAETYYASAENFLRQISTKRRYRQQDDQNNYRVNEIAIYWNATLIYALAASVDEAGTCSSTK